MPAPEIIHQLVQQFAENRAEYRSPRYNEAQLRHEFLDKFFEALGWDVYNRLGYSLDSRDVIVEDSVEIEGHSKNPDYAFKIGRERKFYVEAKKPNVDIKFDYDPAFQLRRYAWNQHLALSVLTDFEEFSLYDCREKPAVGVSPATSRLMYVRYDEYIDRWDEIAGILSKEAVYKGSFDRYVVETRGKKGTTEVDDEFLKDIEEWRKKLALNLALRNADIRNERQLNFAVQMTIDRIIFLRICEDRGIEPTEQLLEMSKAPNIYQNLVVLFTRADTKYNSGLFHFNHGKDGSTSADTFTPSLLLDDRVLKEIIKGLYYPCPYIFKEIPVEILGQVYEQFLGKVIRLTPAHQAKVEEKPEVRKAGGVYYTPRYIVDYIVANTVGKLLEGKMPEDASALKIVDPACGSGSFLLGAFQYLMDWHEDWYINHDPGKWAKGKNPALTLTKDGWQLTTAEKKRILVNNIHGVDIDAQAVEVTKLSLLLKVLEEETGQLSLGLERVLPDLGRNIQCGNSLIGWDYFDGQLVIDEAEKERVNPFDWKQAFPDVFRQGGFDAVIGNPPYLFITEVDKSDKEYYSATYSTIEYRFDVYGLFTEVGIKKLLRKNGVLGFITPHTLLSNDSFYKLRQLLITKSNILEVIDIGPNVFEGANNETMVFIVENCINPKETRVVLTSSKHFPIPLKEFSIDQVTWLDNSKSSWVINLSDDDLSIIKKMDSFELKLIELCSINQGLRTGNNEKFLSLTENGENWKPVVGGKHIGRYKPCVSDTKVNYDVRKLDAPRKKEIFESAEKIVVQEVRNITLLRRIVATFDNSQYYCLQSTNVINLKPNISAFRVSYLLGIINSSSVNFYFRLKFPGNNHIASNQLGQIPIPKCEGRQQQLMVSLVERMLDLHERTPQTPQEQESLNREIAATDQAIDRLVYELYGLTEEEIRIVEG